MEEFIAHLEARGMSRNTVCSYRFAIRQLLSRCSSLSDESLLAHKDWLVTGFSAKTANLRIGAINNYLDFTDYPGLRLKGVRIQQKPFLDNVISQTEYEMLRDGLKRDENWFWYFIIRFLACTGARVSELRQMTTSAIYVGHLDIISKGDKLRRIYIPASLQQEAIGWLKSRNMENGYIFTNCNGGQMSARGISLGLKRCAVRYGVNADVVYPHSFRHLFAKNFIARDSDIAFLADLMGHESIETTRIYLRRTAAEQRAAVNSAIDW
ncbi:phage integrase [Bifidobacterium porcinum]|nr:phage integrase [Bifidobacterium porcinum]